MVIYILLLLFISLLWTADVFGVQLLIMVISLLWLFWLRTADNMMDCTNIVFIFPLVWILYFYVSVNCMHIAFLYFSWLYFYISLRYSYSWLDIISIVFLYVWRYYYMGRVMQYTYIFDILYGVVYIRGLRLI